MGALQPWHLIVVLVVVLILFGVGKLPETGSALAKGIREFRQQIKADDDGTAQPPANAGKDGGCPQCRAVNPPGQRFCGSCGASLASTRP